ncbi:c-type cytochrome [Chryseolinea lacunae]|uniref:Cytochrome c n=1 Tax=Chryseolinea lacunae TaxID=2801331 RepID=A0ABS1KSR6_9BACT|nr:cytochrome c [Chryseolinea lacunae]MBL0742400.1 cytochrome c [Chryseolinea lacunae]
MTWAACLCWFGCSSKPAETTDVMAEGSPKFQQYYVHGKELYTTYCSNCHQQSGTGLGRLYPPLNVSDYVDANQSAVLCLMRNGKEGELTVNGKSFNKKMPAIPALTDIEIAEIATYIYNSWGRTKGIVEVQQVSRVLASCDTLR